MARADEQPTKAKQPRSKAGTAKPKRQKLPTIPVKKPKKDAHPFDNLTKGLFSRDGTEIIAELMPDFEVVSMQNIEIDRSKLKADLVFLVYYKGKLAVLNLELQSQEDDHIGCRLLQYAAGLYDLYELPVLTAVIYLFRCNPEQPPFRIECVDKKPITFDYDVICLWEVESQWIMDRKTLPLYVLLPGTNAPTVHLLKQALKEMQQAYKRYELEYRLMWFSHILRRTDMMSDADKQTILEVIATMLTYEEILHDDPIFQRFLARHQQQAKSEGEERGKAEGKAEGLAEGLAEGRAEGLTEGRAEGLAEGITVLKESILSLLTIRFSAALAAQAQAALASIQSIDVLKLLFQRILRAPDEQAVRFVLDLPSE
jgi:predicted transposase YdaD